MRTLQARHMRMMTQLHVWRLVKGKNFYTLISWMYANEVIMVETFCFYNLLYIVAWIRQKQVSIDRIYGHES